MYLGEGGNLEKTLCSHTTKLKVGAKTRNLTAAKPQRKISRITHKLINRNRKTVNSKSNEHEHPNINLLNWKPDDLVKAQR